MTLADAKARLAGLSFVNYAHDRGNGDLLLSHDGSQKCEDKQELQRADLEREYAAMESAREAEEEERHRQTRLQLGLLIPSLGLLGASGITLAVARTPDSTSSRNVCTIGKPCGNTCIAVSDTCSIGGSSGGPNTHVTRAGWIAASSLFVLGVGLLVAALVAPKRLKPRRVACGPSGCSLTLRF